MIVGTDWYWKFFVTLIYKDVWKCSEDLQIFLDPLPGYVFQTYYFSLLKSDSWEKFIHVNFRLDRLFCCIGSSWHVLPRCVSRGWYRFLALFCFYFVTPPFLVELQQFVILVIWVKIQEINQGVLSRFLVQAWKTFTNECNLHVTLLLYIQLCSCFCQSVM